MHEREGGGSGLRVRECGPRSTVGDDLEHRRSFVLTSDPADNFNRTELAGRLRGGQARDTSRPHPHLDPGAVEPQAPSLIAAVDAITLSDNGPSARPRVTRRTNFADDRLGGQSFEIHDWDPALDDGDVDIDDLDVETMVAERIESRLGDFGYENIDLNPARVIYPQEIRGKAPALVRNGASLRDSGGLEILHESPKPGDDLLGRLVSGRPLRPDWADYRHLTRQHRHPQEENHSDRTERTPKHGHLPGRRH
ncbi:MAG TPA: hypothetical protein VIE89_28370 [Candidatus Binatia bacterium]